MIRAFLLFFATSCFGNDFLALSRLGYQRNFVAPKTLTDYLSERNAAAQTKGYEGYNLSEMNELESLTLFGGYIFSNQLDAGLEVTMPYRAVSKTSAKDSSGRTLNESVELLSTSLGFRTDWNILIFNAYRMYLAPTVGVSWYQLSLTTEGAGTSFQRVKASNEHLFYRLALGGDTLLSKSFGIYLEGGYEWAKSESLEADDVQNSSEATPGSVYQMTSHGASDLDLSGGFVSFGVSLWI